MIFSPQIEMPGKQSQSDRRFSFFLMRGKTFARLLLALFAAIILLPRIADGQSADDVIKIETDLAAFEVSVTDRQGNPVKNLKAGDFRIFEDGKERKIDFFEPLKKQDSSRPLAVVFTLDVSGSMTADELTKLQGAMQVFVQNLANYNSYFAVMTFGMEVKTLQAFTNRPEKIEKVFGKLLKDENGLSSHAYDAVDDAVRLLQKKSPSAIKNQLPKRAVILVTDGFPVGDTVAPKTVIERANDAETTVYSVILPSFSRLQGGKKPLPTLLDVSGLIEKTGGRSFYISQNNYAPLFKSLAEEITASYLLAIYPNDQNRADGKSHQVRIETSKDYVIKQNRTDYKSKN